MAEKGGANADADGQEGLVVAVEAERDVVDLRRPEDDAEGADQRLTAQHRIIGPVRKHLVVERRIRDCNNGAVLTVDNRHVEDGGRIVDDGGQLGVQASVEAERIGDSGAHRSRVVGVELTRTQACIQGLTHLKEHIVGEVVGGVPGLLDVLLEQLAQPERGKNHHDRKHQAGNGEDEFGLEPHVRGLRSTFRDQLMGGYRHCPSHATFILRERRQRMRNFRTRAACCAEF